MLTARRLATYTHERGHLTPRQRRRATHKANRLDTGARKIALAAIAALVAGAACGAAGPAKTALTATAGPALTRDPIGHHGAPQTTTSTTEKPRPPAPRVSRNKGPAPSHPKATPGDPWGCIRQYESGGTTDPAGSNIPGEGYYGFTDSTWDGMDGRHDGQYLGHAHASGASYNEQTAAAQALQQRSGWGQWSTAKRCGLA